MRSSAKLRGLPPELHDLRRKGAEPLLEPTAKSGLVVPLGPTVHCLAQCEELLQRIELPRLLPQVDDLVFVSLEAARLLDHLGGLRPLVQDRLRAQCPNVRDELVRLPRQPPF